jgi:pimeloyl-ACP methyl ester carboxylesterase
MRTVTSKDGTTIAFDQAGEGHPLILVGGALSYREFSGAEELVERLAGHFTVINYDRRGRGDSSDTPPYAVEREVEDIEALIDGAGGSAYLYGISSGAVLALEAAARLPGKVKGLLMYEPPFIVDNSRPPVAPDYVDLLNEATAAGRPGDAVEIFMTKALLIPAEFIPMMKGTPVPAGSGPTPADDWPVPEGDDAPMQPPAWEDMEKVGHTLVYDAAVMGDTMSGKPLPNERVARWAAATMPTLVMSGGKSEAFFHSAATSLVEVLPNAKYRLLEGQDHAVSPKALAPVLVEFFAGK